MKIGLGVAALATLLATPSLAVVVSGTLVGGSAASDGHFIIASPPATLGEDNFGDDNVRAYNERQNVALASATLVNRVTATLAAGTRVDSQYFNFDPATMQTAIGSATFATAILGVISGTDNLVATDYLTVPGLTFDSPPNRGLEANDSVSYTGKVLIYSLVADSPGDGFRVLTAAVPEPASWAMLLAGFGAVGTMARRRTALAS